MRKLFVNRVCSVFVCSEDCGIYHERRDDALKCNHNKEDVR